MKECGVGHREKYFRSQMVNFVPSYEFFIYKIKYYIYIYINICVYFLHGGMYMINASGVYI